MAASSSHWKLALLALDFLTRVSQHACEACARKRAGAPASQMPRRVLCFLRAVKPSQAAHAGDGADPHALRQRLEQRTGLPVELIDTHISWVLLAGERAYKLKKAVRLPFVDATDLAARRHLCMEELRRNRRLAASVYLGMLSVMGRPQAPRLDGHGAAVDHLVCMRRFADKIVGALTQPCTVERHEIALGGSIGIAYCPDDAQDADSLMRYADMAMYRAKSAGRGRCALYSANVAQEIAQRALVRERLKLALDAGLLQLYYQPQVGLPAQTLTGLEALLRWTDAELGEQHPADFIPIAESSDLIVPIGEWVIETACRQAVVWRNAGLPVRVAVNLSARQLRNEALADQIRATLERHGLEPGLLELEITESEAMADPKRTGQLLKRLHGLGVAIALDDFGTGHSSLAYLRELPVTRLKIDREFIRPIGEPGTETVLVKAILALACTLGLEVVAEGVETQAQLEFLRANRCDAYQGWLFAKAVPADQVPALLRVPRP